MRLLHRHVWIVCVYAYAYLYSHECVVCILAYACMLSLCLPINILCIYVTLLNLSWPGKKDNRDDFRSNKAFEKIVYEIQTPVEGKSAQLCLFPGQLKRKQLYKHSLYLHVCILCIRTYAYFFFMYKFLCIYLQAVFQSTCMRHLSLMPTSPQRHTTDLVF
jgi:hypothetical protein